MAEDGAEVGGDAAVSRAERFRLRVETEDVYPVVLARRKNRGAAGSNASGASGASRGQGKSNGALVGFMEYSTDEDEDVNETLLVMGASPAFEQASPEEGKANPFKSQSDGELLVPEVTIGVMNESSHALLARAGEYTQRTVDLNREELMEERMKDDLEERKKEFANMDKKIDKVDLKHFKTFAEGVIFPSNRFIFWWDLLILFLIFFVVLYVPVQVGVSDGEVFYQGGFGFLMFTFVNVLFIVDTSLNFFRAYLDEEGSLVMSRKKIVKHYLYGWFIIDALACFPVDSIYRFVDTTGRVGINVIAFVNLLRLFRVGRVYRILRTNRNILETRLKYYRPALELVYVVFVICIFVHWFGCTFCFIALVEARTFDDLDLMNPDRPSWLQTYVLDGGQLQVVGTDLNAVMSRYILSLYWSIITTTSIGYGDITPVTLPEHIFAVLTLLLAGLMWAYVLAVTISTFERMSKRKSEYRDRLTQINSLVRLFRSYPGPLPDSHVDHDVAFDARMFLYKQFLASKGIGDGTLLSEISPVLNHMPPRLRNRICLSLIKDSLLTISYFRHESIDIHTLGGIAALCELHQYNTGEVMFLERRNRSAKRGVFVMRKGVLAKSESAVIRIRNMQILCGRGTILEDYALLPGNSEDIPAIITIAFWTFTELIFVPRRAIQALFRLHPEAWREIGRWKALRAKLKRWSRLQLGRTGLTSPKINRYSSDEFFYGDRDEIRRINAATNEEDGRMIDSF